MTVMRLGRDFPRCCSPQENNYEWKLRRVSLGFLVILSLLVGLSTADQLGSTSTPPDPKEREISNLTDELAEVTLSRTPGPAATSRADHGRAMGDGFTNLISRFSKVLDLGKVVREIETSVMTSVSCTACRAGVGLLFHYVHSGRTNEEISTAATKLCINLKMQTPRVCSGIIALYIDEVVEVLRSVLLDSNDICALVVGETCGKQHAPRLQWNVAFPPIPKPPVMPYPEPKMSAPRLKVLQISDTHWDPHYEPGSNAECHECKRSISYVLPSMIVNVIYNVM